MSKKETTTTNKNIIAAIAERLPDEERPVENNPMLKKLFFIAFAIITALTFFLASKTGINADEDFQVKYSESLVNWYATMGKDTTATNLMYRNAPMHYYGGFFEVIAGATNRALGNKPEDVPYHDVRHFLVAVCGLLTLLFTALAAREVAGWKAALVALGLMALSPYFIGNAVMNPKDIPFAMGFAMSIYFIIMYLRDMPAPRKRVITGLVISLVIALGTRAGGILLIAYFGLFTIVHILRNYNVGKFFANRGLFLSYLRTAAIIVVLGYFGALLFWPFGLISPFVNPLKALSEFDKFSVGIKVLFEGTNVFSDKAPNNYAPMSFFITTPLLVSIGFALGVLFCWRLFKRFNPTAVFIGLFTAIFPVLYVIYKDSNMYNNWRHLLFIYPGVILIATLFFTFVYEFLAEKNKMFGFAFLGLLVLGIAPSALHILKNNSIPYFYYNSFVGGEKGAFGNYESDYWGISMREGTEFLEKQGIFNQNTGKPIVVATNMGYAGRIYLTKKYGDKVKVIYVSYTNRHSQAWDYGLFTSLFVDGGQLRAGKWPMQSSIYTVKANDVPILAVMQQDTTQLCFKAQQALKQNNLEGALANLSAELAQHPDNEWAIDNMVNCQMAAQNFGEAKKWVDERAKLTPNNPDIVNMQGEVMLRSGDARGAINLLSQNVKKYPDNAMGFCNLAMAQAQTGDLTSALANVEKSIKIAPSKEAYLLLAQIYEAKGNKAAAQNIRAQLQ